MHLKRSLMHIVSFECSRLGLKKSTEWGQRVEIFCNDMRYWSPPKKVEPHVIMLKIVYVG